MKKIISLLIALVLLLSTVPATWAAGSASMSGPATVRAGDTITVSFSAGGGILGGSGSISFDSSLLTLQGYTQKIGGSWVVEFSGNNFVFYDNSMASPIDSKKVIFTATFKVNSNVAAGTAITVQAKGVTLSDGTQDTSAGSPSYKVTVAPPLSGNCNLASLSVSDGKLSPAFSAGQTEYSVSVPFSVASLNVSAAAEHAGAKVSIGKTALEAGETTKVKITVTAENGATKTYTIKATRAQDPNYVESDNANLKELTVEGHLLSPAFSPDVTQYYVWLPYETETITIDAKKDHKKAKLSTAEPEALLPGQGNDVIFTVTAENGTQKLYTVTVVRAPAHADAGILLDRWNEPIIEPTEPPTEPSTEPATEPTTEPTTVPTTVPETEPETVPPTEPVPQDLPVGTDISLLITVGILCAIGGAAIAAVICILIIKKKKAFWV